MKLFQTAKYLKLNTPLWCILQDTILFREFINLHYLYLQSLNLNNNPAELVEFLLQLLKQIKLIKLAELHSSLKNYWIYFLTTLTNYNLSFQLYFFILSFNKPYKKGLWCLNGYMGAYPPKLERIKKGFHQLQELVIKLYI
jgi:hypothetical protein